MSKATKERGPHPKKAGPKRPPHLSSYRNKQGKRHWK